MRGRLSISLAVVACVLGACVGSWLRGARPAAAAATPTAAETSAPDPFLWLEDVHGVRALAWVKAQNEKTLAVLRRDPRFAGFYADAVAINGAKDRIPGPTIVGGRVYNFWQGPEHVRGIWRSTTLADYAKPSPNWTTVLDLDALAKTENENWVWQGADCDSPSRTLCMISLSEGGEDASTEREFDLRTERFVPGGFVLPRGKQSEAWVSDDELLVAREWTPGELTASGYPYDVKLLKRGEPLAGATEVFRGSPSDVAVQPYAITDGDGRRALFIDRGISFFEDETHFFTPSGTPQLAIPLKAQPVGLVAGRLLIHLQQDWTANGTSFPALHLRPTLVYAPRPRESFDSLATTRDRLLITSYDNVRGRAAAYAPTAGDGWSQRALDLPDNATIAIASSDPQGSGVYLYVTSFLSPNTLWLADTATGSLTTIKAQAPKFDASQEVVEQHEATSQDGTQIPYFVVRPKAMTFDGKNPTVLYGYGGFDISITPYYSGVLGKLWLERGGVFAIANIRGGGEFGPAWHEAALTVHRERAYDDFAAVAEDLIARKITDPRHLGIQGGSNGGLLMGVEFTQHPELWNAVDMQVPLLDMLRYEKIEAGASWVGEYGSVSNPAQRAFLASISPYQNLKAGVRYPMPFIWTTTKDDRVGPQHARKFAAKLAAMGIPYLFYEQTEGGHGSGTTIDDRSFIAALEWTYFTRQLMP